MSGKSLCMSGRKLLGRSKTRRERKGRHFIVVNHPGYWRAKKLICLIQQSQQVDHFDDRQCGFFAFVAGLGTGTLNSLFDRVSCQHTDSDRNAMLTTDRGDAARALTSDVIEMRRRTADHCAKRHDTIASALYGHLFQQRLLQRLGKRRFHSQRDRLAGGAGRARLHPAEDYNAPDRGADVAAEILLFLDDRRVRPARRHRCRRRDLDATQEAVDRPP